jgi:hypothetical protein
MTLTQAQTEAYLTLIDLYRSMGKQAATLTIQALSEAATAADLERISNEVGRAAHMKGRE